MSYDIKTVKIKDKRGIEHTFQFINDWRSYNYGFTHISNLYRVIDYKDGGRDSVWINEGRAHWINRTWETWTYQTACKAAVYNEINEIKEHIKQQYKDAQGFKKITAKRRAGLEAEYQKNERLEWYTLLLKELNNGLY